MLGEALDHVLLMMEGVGTNRIVDAIRNHTVVQVSYDTEGKGRWTKPRDIEVYGYGLSKAGNEVIRTFQRQGDTKTKVPHWKFMRTDRILYWKERDETFDTPPEERYNTEPYNPHKDDTMSTVFLLADMTPKVHPQDNGEGDKPQARTKHGKRSGRM